MPYTFQELSGEDFNKLNHNQAYLFLYPSYTTDHHSPVVQLGPNEYVYQEKEPKCACKSYFGRRHVFQFGVDPKNDLLGGSSTYVATITIPNDATVYIGTTDDSDSESDDDSKTIYGSNKVFVQSITKSTNKKASNDSDSD